MGVFAGGMCVCTDLQQGTGRWATSEEGLKEDLQNMQTKPPLDYCPFFLFL